MKLCYEEEKKITQTNVTPFSLHIILIMEIWFMKKRNTTTVLKYLGLSTWEFLIIQPQSQLLYQIPLFFVKRAQNLLNVCTNNATIKCTAKIAISVIFFYYLILSFACKATLK